jgi:flagellar hook assembly protein FlgD
MVTSTENGTEHPNDFTLSQNYPNPFNPTTNISYGLPKAANVEIKVYDMAGREVAELVSRKQSAGRHTVQFNASSLASGVYVYRLTAVSSEAAGNTMYTLTRKMALIK